MDLGWWELIGKARAREPAALEEVQFALGPWAHGVLLAHVSHAEAARLSVEVLAKVLAGSASFGEPVAMIRALIDEARAAVKRAQVATDPVAETDALRALATLKRMGGSPAERAVLRFVEGFSGADVAEALEAPAEEVRQDLAQAARLALDAPVDAKNTWLWSLEGAPHAELGRLEMRLSALRHDWSTADLSKSVTPVVPRAGKATDEGAQLFAKTPAAEGGHTATRNVVDLPAAGQLEVTPQRVQHLPGRAPTPAAGQLEVTPQRVQPLPARAPTPAPAQPSPGATLVEGDVTDPVGRPLPVQARPVPSPPARRRRTKESAPLSLLDEPEPEAAPDQRSVPTAYFQPLVRQPRRFIVLGLGLLLVSAVFAQAALRIIESRVRSGWSLVPTVVVSTDVPAGTPLTFDMLALRDMPEQYVHAGVVSKEQLDLVVNQRVMVPMQAGDPLLWPMLESSVAWRSIANRVLAKARAYTVAVDGARGVGDMVTPRDQVDLVMTPHVTGDQQPQQQSARTFMQNVTVLSAGKRLDTGDLERVKRSEARYSSLTLLMLPEEAEQVALANTAGAFHVTLREPEDFEPYDNTYVTRCSTQDCTLFDGQRVSTLQKRHNTIAIIRSKTAPK